jgi:hypothetical protein
VTRDDLIEAGAQAITRTFGSPGGSRHAAEVVLDAVEPLIRADEQKQYDLAMFSQYRRDRDAEMADLRAKVEALRDTAIEMRDLNPDVYLIWQQDADVLNDVLALIDGDDE